MEPKTQIIKEIEQQMRENIVIVNVIERTSEGYYNYKTKFVAVHIPPKSAPYEEQDIPPVKTYFIYCGVHQDIRYCEDVLRELKKRGFTVIKRY